MPTQLKGTKLRIDADIEKDVWKKAIDEGQPLTRIINQLLRQWLGGEIQVAAIDDKSPKMLHILQAIRANDRVLADALDSYIATLHRRLEHHGAIDTSAATDSKRVAKKVSGKLGGVAGGPE